MSNMTVLYKFEKKTYITYLYENFNEIQIEKDDIWPIYNPSGIGTFKSKDDKVYDTEEDFVTNYGNPFASPHMERQLYVIEENEDKIAFKIYNYHSFRNVGKKYFKVRKTIKFLTFNFKRKIFYLGEASFKRKIKIGFKCKMNVPNLMDSSFVGSLYRLGEQQVNDLLFMFLDKIREKLGFEIKRPNLPFEYYYETILKLSKIKYPDAFFKFSTMFAPVKDIRKYDSNLVTYFMRKNDLKGKKIKTLLNKYDKLDVDNIIQLYRFFGQDMFNKIDDNVFLTNELYSLYSIYTPAMEGNLHNSTLTKKEKENVLTILNNTRTRVFVPTLIDHIGFKKRLKKYGENVKIEAKTLVQFTQEHVEWSTLVQSYNSGHVTRSYGEESNLVEEPIHINNTTYFPVLLKTTEQYENESTHQSNCVRTYSEKPYCLIISLRKDDINGDKRATIEYQFNREGIRRSQTLGKYNQPLSEDWHEPIIDLDQRLTYYYMKEIIELPEMVKRYPNGKTIKTVSNFTDEKEPFFEMLPKWFNEDMTKTENSYNNPFDEYLFDLL
jgi:hypothetical protein